MANSLSPTMTTRTEKNATRAEAIAAWKELKALDVPKYYRSWVKARRTRVGARR